MISFFKGLFSPGRGRVPYRPVQVRPWGGIMRIREDIIESLRQYHNGQMSVGRSNRGPFGQYDAAQTTYQNENHWKWADELSPNSAHRLSVRKKLRSRSRYECGNNGYLKGIILCRSGDTVGTGPSLQITDPLFSQEQRLAIEKAYEKHQKSAKLRRKLFQLAMAKPRDGEAFAHRIISAKISSPVRTTQRVIECDQITHYNEPMKNDGSEIDGVRVNTRTGEVMQYHLLDQHPGEAYSYHKSPISGQWVEEKDMIHWFRRDRPYLRGVPETVPTLPLWALLRRYTLAVVQNAEIAADFTVLLKSLQAPAITPFSSSGSPSQPSDADSNNWFDSFPIDRGLMTVLPDQHDVTQLDPKQPVSTYDTFVNALIQEAARPLLVPRNMAIGNSGDYNMASGALDRQMYISAVDNERFDCGEEVLDKDLEQWWFEAVRVDGYFGNQTGSIRSVIKQNPDLREEPPEHTYRWDEIPEHHDPVKVATATNILHLAGHLSDIDIQEGRFNRRVEDHYANLEEQQKRRSEIGIAGASPDQAAMATLASDLKQKEIKAGGGNLKDDPPNNS